MWEVNLPSWYLFFKINLACHGFHPSLNILEETVEFLKKEKKGNPTGICPRIALSIWAKTERGMSIFVTVKHPIRYCGLSVYPDKLVSFLMFSTFLQRTFEELFDTLIFRYLIIFTLVNGTVVSTVSCNCLLLVWCMNTIESCEMIYLPTTLLHAYRF